MYGKIKHFDFQRQQNRLIRFKIESLPALTQGLNSNAKYLDIYSGIFTKHNDIKSIN